MRRIIATALLLCASPTLADSTIAIVPVFSQLVTMPLPQGFVPAFEDASATNYINEAIPQGETTTAWGQMVTLTGVKGLATGDAKADLAGFVGNLAAGYQGACPNSFTALALDPPQVLGANGVYAGFLGCGNSGAGQSEQVVFLVLVGTADIYTLQWAARGQSSDSPIAFEDSFWLPLLAELSAAARICDPVPGEAPPYPSCLSD